MFKPKIKAHKQTDGKSNNQIHGLVQTWSVVNTGQFWQVGSDIHRLGNLWWVGQQRVTPKYYPCQILPVLCFSCSCFPTLMLKKWIADKQEITSQILWNYLILRAQNFVVLIWWDYVWNSKLNIIITKVKK